MTRQVETASLSHDLDTLASFDYTAPAEMYIARSTFGRGRLNYLRFASAALAIRFAIEELPVQLRRGAVMEVLEARFDHQAIRQLYERLDYPLLRHQPIVEAIGQSPIHCEANKSTNGSDTFSSSRPLGDRAPDELRKDFS